MFIEVDRTEAALKKPLCKLFSSVFDTAELQNELVVNRAEIRMVGVDKDIEMIPVFLFEVSHRHLTLCHCPGILCHIL
ncbi:hypothetical protein BMS3Bbin07_00236 [bacterium BMS3Bbin07]|nr:hypothetical protein BMS3Bbin07_00236 [bacterium BMS3Bbin07]